jgi:insertion element IS1 protein InsB
MPIVSLIHQSPRRAPGVWPNSTSCSPSSGVKNEIYVVTQVDRATHCIVGWDVLWERTTTALQDLIERSPNAEQYYSDDFVTYKTLVYYPGHHTVAPGKSQTYSVEADNAELRHYLARLGRKSRCFSRCIHALWRTIKLFVYAWNRRQLHKLRFPRYSAHLRDFVCP